MIMYGETKTDISQKALALQRSLLKQKKSIQIKKIYRKNEFFKAKEARRPSHVFPHASYPGVPKDVAPRVYS